MVLSKQQKKFDEWISRELEKKSGLEFMAEALAHVADTAYGATLAAEAAFGKSAKPEHALKILELTFAMREKLLSDERNHIANIKAAIAAKGKK